MNLAEKINELSTLIHSPLESILPSLYLKELPKCLEFCQVTAFTTDEDLMNERLKSLALEFNRTITVYQLRTLFQSSINLKQVTITTLEHLQDAIKFFNPKSVIINSQTLYDLFEEQEIKEYAHDHLNPKYNNDYKVEQALETFVKSLPCIVFDFDGLYMYEDVLTSFVPETKILFILDDVVGYTLIEDSELKSGLTYQLDESDESFTLNFKRVFPILSADSLIQVEVQVAHDAESREQALKLSNSEPFDLAHPVRGLTCKLEN